MKFPGRISRRWIQFETIRQGNRTKRTEEPDTPAHTIPHLADIDTGIGGGDITPLTIYIATVIKPEHPERLGKGVLDFHIK